jgi:hypothetical protein
VNENLASRVLTTAVADPPHAITVEAVRGAMVSRRRRGALISVFSVAVAAGVTAAAVLTPAHSPVLSFAGANAPLTKAQAASAEATLAERLHFLGVSGSVAVAGEHVQVRASLPTAWLSSLEQVGAVQFRPVLRTQAVTSPASCPDPETTSGTACNHSRTTLFTLGPTILTNAELSRVQATGSTVQLYFNATGRRLFGSATERLAALGYPHSGLAICVDGTVIFASQIEAAIPGGQANIIGDFTHQQARLLAAEISGKPLPEQLEASSS